jgi:hypothetical protein
MAFEAHALSMPPNLVGKVEQILNSKFGFVEAPASRRH